MNAWKSGGIGNHDLEIPCLSSPIVGDMAISGNLRYKFWAKHNTLGAEGM